MAYLTTVKEILDSLKGGNDGSIRTPNATWDPNDPRDLIDFPCSDSMLDYYHMRGLTPRHSENYRGQRPDYKYYQLQRKSGDRL